MGRGFTNETVRISRRGKHVPDGLNNIQAMALKIWRRHEGFEDLMATALFEILSEDTRMSCAAALGTIDGTNARWPMPIDAVKRMVEMITSDKVGENESHFDMRRRLLSMSEHYRTMNEDADEEEDVHSIEQIERLIEDQTYTQGGRQFVKLLIKLGEPYDGKHGVTTGTVILSLLVRALWVSNDNKWKRIAISDVIYDFIEWANRNANTTYIPTDEERRKDLFVDAKGEEIAAEDDSVAA